MSIFMVLKSKKMNAHTTLPKIEKFIEKKLIKELVKWHDILKRGQLYDYEKEIQKTLVSVFNYIGEQLLPEAANDSLLIQKRELKESGCVKLEQRKFRIRLSTGHEIKVNSYYAKQIPADWIGSRHSISRHWKIIGNGSPGLYDRVGFCSALGPSYDVGHQVLSKFNTGICLSSVRDINNQLADHCFTQQEEELLVRPNESLEGKRVVLSIDGGRTRTRTYTGQINQAGNHKFDTNWREPKLFVIDVLNESGQPDENALPIYGCRFGEQDVFKLLSRYLKKLKVSKVKSIQILGDGAPWIWNHTKETLLELGVAENKIIETLDYYHASSYVHDLIEKMPKVIGKEKRKMLLKEFKAKLWQGKSTEIVARCREIYKRPSKIIKRWLNYLDKHNEKTQYTDYQGDKLMCGSGIIESAIRRVINLRFKNASTFWNEKTVEKMYFLRGALLSKRWNILMNNLVN